MAGSGPSPVDHDGGCAAQPPPDLRAIQPRAPPPAATSAPLGEGPAPLPSSDPRTRADLFPARAASFPYLGGKCKTILPEIKEMPWMAVSILKVAALDEFIYKDPLPYIESKINKCLYYVEEMEYGYGLSKAKMKYYDELSQILCLPMSCTPDKKSDDILMEWDHFKFATSLASNPPYSKVLLEPFHGIESFDAYFNWDGGEQFLWALPIMRPLGPPAQAIDLWLDSGCVHHVVREESILVDLRAPPPGKMLKIADGSLMPVHAVGTIKMPGFLIPEVYYVPGVVVNLISPQQLAVHNKINSALDDVSCVLWTGPHIGLVGEGIRDERRGLYRLTFLLVP